MLQCRYHASCRNSTAEDNVSGWNRQKFRGCRQWVCPACQEASNSNLEVRVPPGAGSPLPGYTIELECFFLVRCEACSILSCFLHSLAPKKIGWLLKGHLYTCPTCIAAQQADSPDATETRDPPIPFPKGCETAWLSRRVVALCEALNACEDLPTWVNNATDDTLRAAGNSYPLDPSEPDAGNAAGSVMMLAMLLPEEFGVPGTPALQIFGTPPPASIVQISRHRSRSAIGADNRRTNAVEGLLNFWQNSGKKVRALLLETWILVGRAVSAADPFNKLLVKDMARNCFAVSKCMEDDAWWKSFEEERYEISMQVSRASLLLARAHRGKKWFRDGESEEESDEEETEKDEASQREESEVQYAFLEEALRQWYSIHIPSVEAPQRSSLGKIFDSTMLHEATSESATGLVMAF